MAPPIARPGCLPPRTDASVHARRNEKREPPVLQFRTASTEPAEVLLDRSAAGDAAAFRALYDLEAPRLKAVALRFTRSPALAEDVLHDVFLRVWHRADQYDPTRGPVRAWLTTLTRFRAMDMVRRLGREMSGLDLPDAEDDSPDQLARLLESADGRALHECLGQLGPEQRTLIQRAFIDGHSHAALAQQMGLPLGTVKSKIRRGLAVLRRCLEP